MHMCADVEAEEPELQQAVTPPTAAPEAQERGSAEVLLRSPPPSPDAMADQPDADLLGDAQEAMGTMGLEELPLADQLAQPADIDMEDGADLDALAALSEEAGAAEAIADAGAPDEPSTLAAGVFSQSAAARTGADVTAGAEGGRGLAGATSLELLRETIAQGPGEGRAQPSSGQGASPAPADAAEAPATAPATAPAEAAVTTAAPAAEVPASAPTEAAPSGAVGAAATVRPAAPPAIRAKRSARAPPPPVTVPPPPAAVPPRESRKAGKIRIAKKGRKSGDVPSRGTTPTARAVSEGATGSGVNFICSEGGGPCSGMVCPTTWRSHSRSARTASAGRPLSRLL